MSGTDSGATVPSSRGMTEGIHRKPWLCPPTTPAAPPAATLDSPYLLFAAALVIALCGLTVTALPTSPLNQIFAQSLVALILVWIALRYGTWSTTLALRNSTRHYDTLVEKIPVGLYLMRTTSGGDWAFDYVSPTLAKMLAAPAAAIQADSRILLQAVHPEDLAALVALKESAHPPPQGLDWEGRILVGDRTSWLHITASPEFIASGGVLWHGVVADVTARKLAEIQLKTSEQRLRTLVETEPECVKVLGPGGDLLEINAAGLAMLEAHSIDEVKAHGLSNYILPEYRAAFADLHRRVMSGHSDLLKFEIIGQGGTRRWLETHAAPMRDGVGRVTMVLGITCDITERRKAEDDRRHVLDRVTDAYLALDKNFFYRYANKAAEQIFGRKFEHLVGKHISAAFPDEIVNSFYRAYEQALAKQAPTSTEDYYPSYQRWLETHLYPSPEGLTIYFNDITARKQSEMKRRVSDHALKSISQGVLIADPNGRILSINDAFTKITGYHQADIAGQDCRLLQGPLTDQAVVTAMGLALHGVTEFSGELLHYRSDGSTFWNELTLSPVRDEQGRLMQFIGVIRDVSERKHADLALHNALEALRASERTLEGRVSQRTSELSDTIDRLKQTQSDLVQAEKLASLGALVAGVAHELNTPIGNARIMASAIEQSLTEFTRRVADGGVRKSELDLYLQRSSGMANIVSRSCETAADLVASFKQVAVDQTSEQRRTFDLQALVDDNVAALRPSFKNLSLTIDTQIPDGIQCDSYPGALGQVLTNLIQNAVTHGFHGRESGIIRVTAAVKADGVELLVTDNGHGMDAATLPHIFDPFYTTRMGQGGSGLGLSISRNLVTGVLGGTLNATSAPGQGSQFMVSMPLYAPCRIVQ